VLLQEGERLRLGGCHRADLLGDLLSRNDLRGVFSHGTQRIIEKAKQTGIATMATRNHGSPMAFSAPAGEESSPVLDFGAKMDLSPRDRHRKTIDALAPGLVLRCIGMGEICQSWGGLLCGLPMNAADGPFDWPGANQGSMVITFRIDLFIDPAEFRAQMDEYVRAVRELTPLDGFKASYMAGGVEAELETSYRTEGIPMGVGHRESLEILAGEIGMEVPW
jgi:LDH2 family malate/lactate/ureidoglycolate dehydrogenase